MSFNLYKKLISPVLHAITNSFFGPNYGCRFIPTCSEYSKEAFKKYGIIQGARLTLTRLFRCNPFATGGRDPVK